MKLISYKTALAVAVVAANLGVARFAVADTGDDKKDKDKDEDSNALIVNDKGAVILDSLEPTHREKKQVAWLGVSVEEAPESLQAQLDLKTGEGLIVTMVAANSPASEAEIRKFDVLTEFDGQMLVDSHQLRKLVRMHPKGDSVKLTLYRGGKKISVSAKLSETILEDASLEEGEPFEGFNFKMQDLGKLNEKLKNDLAPLAIDQKKIRVEFDRATSEERKANVEVKRAMEEVKRAIERTMKEHPGHKVLASEDKDMTDLTDEGVSLDKDASVVVKKDMNSTKSILKTDDSGVYIIVADPKRRLTVHDAAGKLLFDGEIETPEEQDKVPREVWEKVKPMVEQLGTVTPEKPQSKYLAGGDSRVNAAQY